MSSTGNSLDAFGQFEEDDIPPLEDFSEYFKSKLEKKTNDSSVVNEYLEPKESENGVRVKSVEKLLGQKDADKSAKIDATIKKEKPKENFGGFKKGFLSAPRKTDHGNTERKKESEQKKPLPLVTPKSAPKDTRVLDEVQENIKSSTSILQSTDWITEDLLKKVEQSSSLGKYLADKEFVEMLSGMQKDPESYYRKINSNPELMKAFLEFCSLMGDHFTKLGSKSSDSNETKKAGTLNSSSSQVKDDSKKLNDQVKDEEVIKILKDERIQKLLYLLRDNPAETQRFLRSADKDLHQKIQTLIQKGYLSVATS